jgi:phytoene dehydrogenase-like protein
MGGLATAALGQKSGLRTALLEAHTKLGGCAGYFGRGPYTFDAGATALMGLGNGEPLGDFFDALAMNFEAVRTPSYRICMPDRDFEIVTDSAAFEEACITTFPGRALAQRTFWRLQAAVGQMLLRASAGVPRLPIRSLSDAAHNLRILGLRGVAAGALSLVTVRDVLRLLGLERDVPFHAMIAMLLQDTAQAGPETVPFANASACLQAYRLGMSRPRGGMRALVEGIGARFASLGGELRTATLVDRVESSEASAGGFTVVTRRGDRLAARHVAMNLPLDRASALLGRKLDGRLVRLEARSRAYWSAFTGYVAFDRGTVADDAPLFQQVLRSYDKPIHDANNVLISLSPPGDPGYGPDGVRVATMSTHTRPEDWYGLDRPAYSAKKSAFADRLMAALARAIPGAPDRLVHAEFATPKSFARYTRRTLGAVGGAPVSRSNSNFRAVGPDAFGPGLWLVGDSVFPGQGTMATVISAARVVERLTGRGWDELKSVTASRASAGGDKIVSAAG